MNQDELKKYINDNILCSDKQRINARFLKEKCDKAWLEQELDKYVVGRSLIEKITLFYKNISMKKCENPNCSNFVEFSSFSIPYRQLYCSNSCRSNDPKIEQKKKQTCIKKYGVENVIQTKEVQEKIKQTSLEHYGTESPWQSDEVKQKIKNTCIKRYGVEHHLQNNEIKEKQKNTILKKTFDLIISKLNITPLFSLQEYQNKREKYQKFLWKCNICGHEFEYYYANNTFPRCPNCFPTQSGFSNEEKEIADWLKSLKFNVDENTKKIISPLELDIYIPSKNLAIEFDGLYWHSELQGVDSKYHLDKTTKCKELGIQLLHVWENEWIEKQDIVKSIIKSKLGLYDRAIGARQCNIKEISNQEASSFYNVNHIQNGINSKANIGLFFGNELVSCISFSKPRYNKAYEWEITRFASLLNTTVHGSFGKLWNYFIKNYKPESLITYSDKRYFDGQIYRKYFTELSDSGPSYWYIKDRKVYNRMEFQKYKLESKLSIFDSNLTEWENMQLNGYDRIWDCGNKVFEWRNNEIH